MLTHSYQRALDLRWDGPDRQLRQIESVWYAFRLAAIPRDATERAYTRDCLFARPLEELLRSPNIRESLVESYGRGGVYAAQKRQLAKRDLRRIEGFPVRLEKT